MSSNFLSSCCDAFSSVDNYQSTHYNISRNIYSRNRASHVSSPKASLKSLTANNSRRPQQPTGKSENVGLCSTVNVSEFGHRKFVSKENQKNKIETSFLKIPSVVEKTIFVPQNHLFILNPLPIKQPLSSRSARVQKVNFMYNKGKNLQIPKHKAPSPIHNFTVISHKEQPLITVPEKVQYSRRTFPNQFIAPTLPIQQLIKQQEKVKSSRVIKNYPFQQILEPQNKNLSSQKPTIVQEEKERKQLSQMRNSAPPNLVFNRNPLGGSKFTVISQQSVEQSQQQKEPKMVESAILVNVFHPTNSQMKNWQVRKSKNSYAESILSPEKR